MFIVDDSKKKQVGAVQKANEQELLKVREKKSD